MIIASQLALVLQLVIGDYEELLQELNNDRAIEGMDPVGESENIRLARERLQLFMAHDASLRYDIDPERSTLIADIEAADGKEQDTARAELDRYDAENPRPSGAPSPAQLSAFLRTLAGKHAPLTTPHVMLELIAGRLGADAAGGPAQPAVGVAPAG